MEIKENWQIESKYGIKNHTFCECICNICGAKRTIRDDVLKKRPPQCSCQPHYKSDYKDLKFGYLKVIEETDNDSCLCECVCGNQIVLSREDIRHRTKLSCGCKKGGKKQLFARICKECGKTFEGGPRAWYCEDCRAIRKKQKKKEYYEHKRDGKSLKIGSEMRCEMCGDTCIRNAARQRFCENCAKINLKQVDREQSLRYYHENKDKINPKRYEFRKKK